LKRSSAAGFSLIELLVALVIGLLAALVIQQVMAVFEGQKRTSGSGSDAQVNGAVALTYLEREVRQAGYGLLAGGSQMCPLGINIYYDEDKDENKNEIRSPDEVVFDRVKLFPILIIDGGAGPDRVVVVRSDADFGPVPTTIEKRMPNPSSEITADSTGGLVKDQLFLVGAGDGSKVCTLMQMSQDPQPTGNGWNLQHNSGQFPFNPPNPDKVFTPELPPFYYVIGDIVINMGSFIARRFEILCDRLVEVDPIRDAGPYDCDPETPEGEPTPLVDQIVDLQAQYGIVDAGSQQITHWCDATATSICGDWSNPTSADIDISRVRALRIAVVARSTQYERDEVSPSSLTLWGDVDAADDDAAPVFALDSAQRHYRYKVFSTIVPIRNLIWGT
jgi:type IV pilus assembly protein PilW